MRSTDILTGATLASALLLGACGDPAGLDDGGNLRASFPLFTNLSEEQFDQTCLDFRAEVRAVRKKDDELLKTRKATEVEWAPDIQTAIERATKADKPIYLVTFVRENGDPHCDVWLGAQVVRVGLHGQKEVRDVLNKYFVPIEIDATAGLPRGVPAMKWLYRAWDESPWTRVSFGTEWVLDPTGQYLLSTGFHKHGDTPITELFQNSLESGLKRFARIRSHERGSPEEAAEMGRVAKEIQRDMETLRPCWVDFDVATEETLDNLGRGDQDFFDGKLSGVFTYDEPAVRRQTAETLGRYAANHASDGFLESEQARFLASKIAPMLDDEDTSVRDAAAVALYRLHGQPVPEGREGALIAGARELVE